jgi:hypothetical protein
MRLNKVDFPTFGRPINAMRGSRFSLMGGLYHGNCL